MTARKMRLAACRYGAMATTRPPRRHPDVPADGTLHVEHYVRSAQIAERGKPRHDLLRRRRRHSPARPAAWLRWPGPATATCSSWNRWTLLPALAHGHPPCRPRNDGIHHLQRAAQPGAQVRHAGSDQQGPRRLERGGVVVGARGPESFGLETTLDYDTRYARSAEFVEVAKGLWDSWDDGALLFDKTAGRYIDDTKMHVLDYHGRFFKVRGPLNVAGMPQGHPVIVQAGAAGARARAGRRHRRGHLRASPPRSRARAPTTPTSKSRMAKYGREPDDLKIMPALCPVAGRTRAEAQAKYDELQALFDPLAGLGSLYSAFGDLSGHALDEPVPDGRAGLQGARQHRRPARRTDETGKPTIRQLYLRAGITGSARIGTPADIADVMQEWLEASACDGFNITPATLPGGGEDFVEMVVPELQRRGLFRTEYEGTTLRENLGLRPVTSRYSRDRRAAE